MINTNLPPVLHRFEDTCRGQSLRPLNWVLNFYYNFKRQWPSMQCTQSYWHKQRYRVLVPPFGGFRGNVHGSSMARWKTRGRLPISANWTFFASYHGWVTMSRYWSKLRCLKGGWVTLNVNFRGKGASPTNEFWHQKTRVHELSYGEKNCRKFQPAE